MNIKNYNLLENRYERKYKLKLGEDWKFKKYLLQNEFQKTFKSRLVNSIYFDSDRKDFFHQNINGISNRIKTRLRWYDNILKINLELKKKSNAVSWKQTFSAGTFKTFYEFKKFYNKNENLMKISHLSGLSVKPNLLVTYKREYWLSPCKNFRATIDKNVEYKDIKLIDAPNRGLDSDFNILEFKYLDHMDSKFRNMINKTKFPFRMTKNSKYVSGVMHLESSGII